MMMRTFANTRTALLIAVLSFTFTAASRAGNEPPPEELKVVFIAYENPDQLMENVKPVVSYLEKALGLKVRHYVATDYAGVVEALRRKDADMGFMGPLQYIIAHDQVGAYPVLGEVYSGEPSYVARIFVRKDSPFKTLADLRGKSIAFTDPLSSSGYLYPLDAFRTAGLIKGAPEDFFKKIYFAGGDEQAIRAVLNDFADAAGIGQYAWNILRPEERGEIRWIGESERIPSHCVVVRKDLNSGTVSKLRSAMLALKPEKDAELLKTLYNVDGYVEVSHETYKDVERLAVEHGYLR